MNTIFLLKNPIQDYAWGSKTEIQSLVGEAIYTGNPMAEMWMGAHPKAPSDVRIDGKWQPLDKMIAANPDAILGKAVAQRFSNQLPFLLKVLAAEKPLSIQVHPNIDQAQKGFEKENRLGIPLDAANRNYKDPNHKPEILCAMTPFECLKGFRGIDEITGLLDRLSLASLSNEMAILRKSPNADGVGLFFTALLEMEKERRAQILCEAVKSAKKFIDQSPAYKWVIKLYNEYPDDIGVLAPMFLNHITLAPSEAIYLPAGELHAYLKGLGMELMANSDNVLRGGLTNKHMDIAGLLDIVDFKALPIHKIRPDQLDPCQSIYETPAEEFLLSTISVDKGRSFTSPVDRNVEVLICVQGEVEIKNLGGNETLPAIKGRSFIVPSAVAQYEISGNGVFYVASVPKSSG